MNQKVNNELFNRRKLVIATMHNKEKVIAPLFESAFGLNCFTPKKFDSDLLGTFSGEIERKDDPITTLRNKCLLAMCQSNCDLGIASEGSFGPHPNIPFVQADDEFIIFIDKKNNLEIIEREISIHTNFNEAVVKTENELIEFADQVKFPSHALILQETKGKTSQIIKGINNWDLLNKSFQTFIKNHGKTYVQTDMRALYNPTRMEVIKNVAKKLVRKINSLCPNCETPGFGINETKRGLPCELCGLPTNSILCYIYVCKNCNHSKEEKYPHQKKFEEPTFCDFCNP